MEDPTIKKAFEVWEEFSRDERKWWEYEARRKAILDENSFKKGIERVVRKEIEKEFEQKTKELEKEVEQAKLEAEQARSEALTENTTEIAKKLLDMKIDLAQIVQVTGLPLEMIQKLERESH